MLQSNPEKRFTATQVRERIQTLLDVHCESRTDRCVPEMPENLPPPQMGYTASSALTNQWECVSRKFGITEQILLKF